MYTVWANQMSKQKLDFSGLRKAFPDAVIGRGRIVGDHLVIFDEEQGESHLYDRKNGFKKVGQYKCD